MSDRVLIVDDSLTVRMDLAEAFESAGFIPVPCATVGEARLAIEANTVSIIVLDVILPDGDGIDFLGELRAIPAVESVPIMMLSSAAEVEHRIRGLKKGADEYIGKPYDRTQVIERARELLRQRHAEAEETAVKVLIIDDSPTYRNILQTALQDGGYAVFSASSGEEGLRVASGIRPNGIIVDGVLPDESGTAVIRRIRLDAALRHTPCMLLTASEGSDTELQALNAGADAFVQKQDDCSLVLARLASMLRSSAGAPAEHIATASLLAPKRILAVDDSATYLHELADELREDEYDVVLARSGMEAIELLSIQPVDCILMDVMMPGLSGQETCRRIKSAPIIRDTPLIMLTALEDRETMLEGLSVGADDYIAKSSDFRVLRARVQAQIRRRQFEDENRRMRERLLRAELEASEARAASEIAKARAVLIDELERKNNELESFSYSVSHDLRAPLRAINGFSQALLDDYTESLDDQAKMYLDRIIGAAKRMGQLIDDMLMLSRVGRMVMNRHETDLARIGWEIVEMLKAGDPGRSVEIRIQDTIAVEADSSLMRIALENLLGNAWKFTSKTENPVIELGADRLNGERIFYVQDNGAGFDMRHAKKLFAPFQRLHSESDFAGTGIGLATVYRVIDMHGGRIWAEAEVGKGTRIIWTLPAGRKGS
jgi:DNA-binding response OmpR family regulator